jgi:PAS domain S-box-containing protein
MVQGVGVRLDCLVLSDALSLGTHNRRSRRSARWRPHPIWATVAILACASASGAQTEPRQALLLYSYESDFASHNAFATMFRPELSRLFGEPIDFIEVSLQAARLNPSASKESIVNEVRSTLPRRRLDLVVPIGGPAAVFAQTYRQQLFPTTPMLLAGVDRRFVQNRAPAANDAAVAVEHDPPQMIETILRLLPDTRTVFVVIGASQFEQFWLKELKRGLRRFEDRLTFIWTNALSFEEMLKSCASLPPHSAIFYGVLSSDAKGVRHTEERTLGAFHAAANAPIFGLHSTQLGHGIVGGPLLSIEDLSRNTATVAVRMLRGEEPQRLTTPTQVTATPAFDGRELRRWGISEDRLQPGSVVLFREPTAWRRYRPQIIAGVTFASVQAVFAIALLASLVKRRRAERSLRVNEESFRLLLNAAPVMIWHAGPDKRCTNVNRGRLDFTGRPIEEELGDGWTEAVHPDDLHRYREIFAEAFDRREPFRMEYRLRRHDGEYRWILDTGVPDGFGGYVGSAIDVTELKLASVALSGLSRRLLQSHEEERAWIARKLNEELCQRLTGLNLQLHSLSMGSRGDVNQMRAGVEELCAQFGDLASDMQAVSDQSSHTLELLGLVASARTFCQQMSARHGVTIDFRHEGVPDNLPNDVALAMFRVLEEALDNAVRHAAVRRVSVSLGGSRDELRLDVGDEGVGFDPEAAMRSHGLGLIGMRERLSLVDGECLIESQPGAGTRIRARVPLGRSD